MKKWKAKTPLVAIILLGIAAVYFFIIPKTEANQTKRIEMTADKLVADQATERKKEKSKTKNTKKVSTDKNADLQEIYLAGGCFWGIEEYFSRVEGVTDVTSGYTNGLTKETSYGKIGATKHAEAVHITYDVNQIKLKELLNYYFRVVDPTSLNKQGNDHGEEYRSAIYYQNKEEKEVIEQVIANKQKFYDQPIVIQVEALEHFILAEEEHQDYLQKNPNGYCTIDLTKLRTF